MVYESFPTQTASSEKETVNRAELLKTDRSACEGVCNKFRERLSDIETPETYKANGVERRVESLSDLMVATAQAKKEAATGMIDEMRESPGEGREAYRAEQYAGMLTRALESYETLVRTYADARSREGAERLVDALEEVDPSLKNLYEEAESKLQ